MSQKLKDFFAKESKPYKVQQSINSDAIGREIESSEYVKEAVKKDNRFLSTVDFATASNFVKFGSARKYYVDSVQRIHKTYPYDGSLKEKTEWLNQSSYLDLYIFENRYPRTTGYAVFSSDGWSTRSSFSQGYGVPGTLEYISLYGGPHKDPDTTKKLAKQFPAPFDGDANLWDEELNRRSNLAVSGNLGNTIETWLEVGTLSKSTFTDKQVVFDLWRSGSLSSSAGYGRVTLELSASQTEVDNYNLLLTAQSGTDGVFQQALYDSTLITTGSWNHVAVSFINDGSNLKIYSYLNGALKKSFTAGTDIGEFGSGSIAHVGALVTAPSGNVFHGTSLQGAGKLSGSLDEFRFWTKRRDTKSIIRNWRTQVAGGTNTDNFKHTGSANAVDLGVYYKFNEGITGTSSTDSTVLDYSGRISNGTWTGYTSVSRNTGSAIVSASAAASEFEDPIIYTDHPSVSVLSSSLSDEGQEWDYQNNSSIYNSLPHWIIESENGTLSNVVQIISSYFDTLALQIDELPRLGNVNYIKEGEKPYPFINTILESRGLIVPEIFVDADVLERFQSRNEERTFTQSIFDTKNEIYQNIYNNLSYIYKTKGTEKSYRNLIRCYGVDDELVKINLYANNETFVLEENTKASVVKKHFANFTDNHSGSIFQVTGSGDSNTRSYVTGTLTNDTDHGVPITVEAEVVFPYKLPPIAGHGELYKSFPQLSASLFGVHTAQVNDVNTNYTWPTNDYDFQVYAVRDKLNSPHCYFQLTSSNGVFPNLTSSLFYNVYDNNEWNFAVRVKPSTHPMSDKITGSVSYTTEFIGVNANTDIIENEFIVSGSMTQANARNFLNSSKRLYIGAHLTNFTGSSITRSDVRVSSPRLWMNYLDNDAIRSHAKNSANYGAPNSYKSAFSSLQTTLSGTEVSPIETLALHWEMATVTASDSSGEFLTKDASSGSTEVATRYGWLGKAAKYQHPGRAINFQASNSGSIFAEYVHSAKQKLPETINSSDMVKVLTDDDDFFTRDHRPITYYISFEKSMYQTISEEILNVFASILDFNNLIGEPVHRYRQSYKSLAKLKQLFFERVSNTPDLDKYVDLYKWIDTSMYKILEQLTPASANISETLQNVVEGHILERNKYWTKFPTVENNITIPETTLLGINELSYNWKFGHAPLSDTKEQNNCLWYKERSERDGVIPTSGDANVDSDRNALLERITSDVSGSWINHTLAHSGSGAGNSNTYLGSTYALRRLSRPFKMEIDNTRRFGGGSNPKSNKNRDFHRSLLNTRFPREEDNRLIVYHSTTKGFDYNDTCNDDEALLLKRNLKFKVSPTTEDIAGQDYFNGDDFLLPFSLFSASVGNIDFKDNVVIANYHDDIVPGTRDVPLQGPFTEKYVGGWQYRHTALNCASSAKSLDQESTRGEGFRFKHATDTNLILTSGQRDAGAVNASFRSDYPKASLLRDETAKRSVNIRNIKQTTGSCGTVIGNYEKEFNVVKVSSGRANNNVYFVDSNGIAVPGESDGSWSGHISGLMDFTLPDRSTTQHVFVNRFSAPGGPEVNARGVLDIESEEYSAYNALPFRNLSVRQPLRTLLSRHTAQFGYDSVHSSPSASFHKTNMNPLNRYEITNAYSLVDGDLASVAVSKSYSNYWVQRAIPADELQYSWITASYTSSYVYGYPNADGEYSSSVDGWVSALQFITASDYGSVQPGTLRAWGHGKPSTEVGFLPTDFAGMNLNIYEPITSSDNNLGYPLTGSIGLSEGSPAYRNDVHVPGLYTSTAHERYYLAPSTMFNTLMLHRNGPYQYPSWKQIRTGEHPVARYHRRNNIISLRDKTSRLLVPVANRLQAGEIKNNATTWKELESSKYKPSKTYTEPALTSKFKAIEYYVWSNVAPAGSSEVAGGDKFSALIMPATLIKATYGNNFANFAVTELRNAIIKKEQVSENLFYTQLLPLYTYNQLAKDHSSITSFGKLTYKETIYPKEANTYLGRVRGRTNYAETMAEIREKTHGQQRTFWRDDYLNRMRSSGSSDTAVFTSSLGYWLSASSYKDPDKTTVVNVGAPSSVWPLDCERAFARRVTTDTAGNHSVSYSSTGKTKNGELSWYNGWTFSGSAGLSNIGTASLQYDYFQTHPRLTEPSVFQVTSSYSFVSDWTANTDRASVRGAARNPWYDSYDDYASDIRGMGQSYTVLPEFRVSEHIESYLDSNDFNPQTLSNTLTIEGGYLADSSKSHFAKVFSHTDFLKHFDVVKKDHVANGHKICKFTLSCQAIKKFLPYQGFYPVNRTVQLGTLFSQSYGDEIRLEDGGSSDEAGRLQAALQPYMAPGILYNSIKSGVAVDWPMVVTSYDSAIVQAVQMFGLTYDIEGFFDTLDPNYRLPFESLYNPSSGKYAFPEGLAYYMNTVHPTETYVSGGLKSADKRYVLAMNNFLAETVRFFLKDGRLSTFQSEPASKAVDSGKTYYMDVHLATGSNFVSYEGPVLRDAYDDVDGERSIRGIHYGPAFATEETVTTEGSTKDPNFTNRSDPAFAPYTPPYFYGTAVATLKYSPDASEIGEDGNISVKEIVANIEKQGITYKFRNQSADLFDNADNDGSKAAEHRMNLGASVDFFKLTNISETTYDDVGIINKKTSYDENTTVWNIGTKFECPVLSHEDYTSVLAAAPGEGNKGTRGTWKTYGKVPSSADNNRLEFTLRETFPEEILNNDSTKGSLIELMGFRKTTEQIGQLRDSKMVNEAIVAIPIYGKDNSFVPLINAENLTFDPTFPMIDRLIGLITPQKYGNMLTEFNTQFKIGSSISDMVSKMKKYVIPPQFDFITPRIQLYREFLGGGEVEGTPASAGESGRVPAAQAPTKSPFVMYIFEFNHEFTQGDLQDIWQGIMPESGTKAEKVKAEISHDIKTGELMGFFSDQTWDQNTGLPDDLRWIVFKVKQRATTEYSSVVDASRGNSPFKSIINTGHGDVPYSYNWPYDFFSLIELAKIDTAIDIAPHVDPALEESDRPDVELTPAQKQAILKQRSRMGIPTQVIDEEYYDYNIGVLESSIRSGYNRGRFQEDEDD